MEIKKISDEKLEEIKSYIDKYSLLDLIKWLNELVTIGDTKSRLYDLINGELGNRMKEFTDSDKEEIVNFFSKYSYLDLVMWHNDLLYAGKINNYIYVLVDHEMMRRNTLRYQNNKEGREK